MPSNHQKRLYVACVALRLLTAEAFVAQTACCATKRRQRQILYHPIIITTRRRAPQQQQQRQQSYYEDDDDKDGVEGGVFEYYEATRVRELDRDDRSIPRRPAAPLRRRTERNDDEYDDDDDDEADYEYESENEDDVYDDRREGKEDDHATTGNFWSNPAAADNERPVSSRQPMRQQQQQQQQPPPRNTRANSSARPSPPTPPRRRNSRPSSSTRRRNTSTFRSGTPPPPAPIRDLYNRLFWYGVQDDEDDDSQSDMEERDATMFGGTKGKFNGLAFLQAGRGDDEQDSNRRRRRQRATRQENDWEYDYDESADYDRRASNRKWVDHDTPPEDPPKPGYSDKPNRRRNRQSNQQDSHTHRDWTSDTVSNWFDEDAEVDEYDDDDAGTESGSSFGRRQGRRQSPPQQSPIIRAIDSFLGLSRKNTQEKAEWYDRQMGFDRQKKRRQTQRRPGYAYPLNDEEVVADARLDDTVVDVDPLPVESVQPASLRDETGVDDDGLRNEKDLSWEERALAVERVPPAGIPAWGPSGELDVDARTRSILDAQEDILNAKRRVKDQEEIVELAREEVAVLRVDSQLIRKRLTRTQRNIDELEDELRQLDLKIDDSSRHLRLSRSRLKRAEEELATLEARHWAVMHFYNPDQISANLADAFKELEETEPAVKRYTEAARVMEKNESAKVSERNDAS